ncbi:DUF6777 domain-containing protein [Streptomyces triticiradicis]|uniref:DUF6777 domain-containing protein n=1 Tax=Streptomyces triticiradicis TaxID=2651189 RepID=A0A7J5D4I2_9ACTN|nr:DUF6777 domain-containing protein [Streptomyces triticiradicis]KAB1978942.1 hypothetical protein F8144_37495 [Streptomyces triticiradicis]
MSVEPPSSGRPTGPPSGPLSGPSQPSPTQPVNIPPAGPPSGASGAGGGAGGARGGGTGGGGAGGPSGPGGGAAGPGRPGGEPEHPWWRSAPRVALITGVVAAAVILGLVFTNNGGGAKNTGGEVFLQAADKTGPDPFTESTANDTSTAPETPATPSTSAPANATLAVSGNAPGLYGGTRNVSSCDVEKQISALKADPAKNKAFASVEGIQPNTVPAYLRSLTPVQLRMDTRVTNHGYRNGAPTSYQAVLQTGTAVLVDSRGVPRVRCACGNPLLPPVAQQGTPRATGDSWPAYRSRDVVVVAPSTTVIDVFVLYDPGNKEWIARERGDEGKHDKKTRPPVNPSPSASVSGSASPCVSPGGSKPASGSPCPSTSASPSSESSSPSSEPSSSEPSTSEPSSSEPSTSEPSTSKPESPSIVPPPPATESGPASGPASADLTTQSGASSGTSS